MNKGSKRSRQLSILVIHGPNLKLLGRRQPTIYGRASLAKINELIAQEAGGLNVVVSCVQSDHEGELVHFIGDASKRYNGILVNPAAYTHTSVAVRDAISACGIPAVEVHLSNIYGREEFRSKSLTAPVCVGQVSGFGDHSYVLGLRGLVGKLRHRRK